MPSTRRTFLTGLFGTAVAVAGCLQEPTGGDASDPTTSTTENGENDPGDDTPEPPGESSYSLTVEPVAERTVAERLDVGIVADQPSAVHEPIRTAIDDRYETDTVADPLARFVASTTYVLVDGRYYSLEVHFPLDVLRLSPVEDAAIDPSAVVGARKFRRDATAADLIGTAIAEGEARRPALPELLHDLVDEYDYVTPTDPDDEDADVYEWEIETVDRDESPYWLEATPVDSAEVFGDEVVAFESLSPDAQAEIQSARGERQVSFDERPAVVDERSFQYVRIDGEFYRVSVAVAN